MNVPSYPFHYLSLKLPNKKMNFSFFSLKLLNKRSEEYFKIILFISFHSIPFFPPKRGLIIMCKDWLFEPSNLENFFKSMECWAPILLFEQKTYHSGHKKSKYNNILYLIKKNYIIEINKRYLIGRDVKPEVLYSIYYTFLVPKKKKKNQKQKQTFTTHFF